MGLSSAEWAAEPRVERVRAMAFIWLRTQVEAFHMFEEDLRQMGHDLERWLALSDEQQQHDLKFIRESKSGD